jgi:hypothetical protein
MSFKDLEQKHNLVNMVILACGKHPVDADINPLLEERLERFYEDAVIEGMAKQMHSSVDRAVNAMVVPTFDWLPKHAAGLYITHNDHKNVYCTIEDHYGYIDDREWVSPEEKLKAIELDSVWELHWYPDTPIGSYKVAASSLEAIQKHMMEHGNAYR